MKKYIWHISFLGNKPHILLEGEHAYYNHRNPLITKEEFRMMTFILHECKEFLLIGPGYPWQTLQAEKRLYHIISNPL